jgi:hypothetical protein
MAKIAGNGGKVHFGTAVNISGASGTTTITITADHSFVANQRIEIAGVIGMTDLNRVHTIASVSTGSFTVILPTATSQTYTSGGYAIACCDITNWAVDIKKEVQDVTDSSQSVFKEFLASDWVEGNGTFEGFFETGALKPSLGESIFVSLKMDASHFYEGDAIITSAGTQLAVEGTTAVKATYGFNFSGVFGRES